MVLPASPKVGLGYNCPMLKIYEVAPQARRINRCRTGYEILTTRFISSRAERNISILKGHFIASNKCLRGLHLSRFCCRHQRFQGNATDPKSLVRRS